MSGLSPRISQGFTLLFLSRMSSDIMLLISCLSQSLWFGGKNTETHFYAAMATTAYEKNKAKQNNFCP